MIYQIFILLPALTCLLCYGTHHTAILPFMAIIRYHKQNKINCLCSASVVSDKYLLTSSTCARISSAHPIENLDVVVYTKSCHELENATQVVKIDTIINPRSNKTHLNGLAIIKLRKDLEIPPVETVTWGRKKNYVLGNERSAVTIGINLKYFLEVSNVTIMGGRECWKVLSRKYKRHSNNYLCTNSSVPCKSTAGDVLIFNGMQVGSLRYSKNCGKKYVVNIWDAVDAHFGWFLEFKKNDVEKNLRLTRSRLDSRAAGFEGIYFCLQILVVLIQDAM